VAAAFAEPGSVAAVRHWLRVRDEEWTDGIGYGFAVVDGADRVLGDVAVSGTGWVSYWTAPAARRQGVATRGVRALAGWAYRELGLVRLELGHRTDNPASCGVAVRAGFRVRGRRRAAADVEMHARLATDPDPRT
jgi:RimJ/RimL family protein N-acetyltransferase